ncbi:MAG: hypothetical protein M3014_08750 [Chloroflexota bacterium]|nr:hypothetical protein [Chloroflexota bacterium]
MPKPPPELPTPTVGSNNPENDNSRLGTPVRNLPDPGFTPLATGSGHIYFVRATHLWRIEPDGSGARQLSDLLVSDPPVPSPDGSLVAFTSDHNLYVIPSSGGMPRKLIETDLTERQRLGWTRDSKMVGYMVYITQRPGVEQAWVVPASGNRASGVPMLIATFEQALVARGPTYVRTVQWSKDGNWVVAGSVNNPLRLLRWPLTNNPKDSRDLAGGEPDWSPDSRTIMYSETLTGALLVYGVSEDKATPFANEVQFIGTGNGEYAEGPGPRWSPAGQGSDTDPLSYLSHTAQGEPVVALRLRSGREVSTLPPLTNHPAWSPSGDRLVAETGQMESDPLGMRWAPNGLIIANFSFTGNPAVTNLVKDGQWPAWGK